MCLVRHTGFKEYNNEVQMTYYLSVTMHLEYIAYLASFDPHSGAVIFKIESKSTFSCVPANWSKTNKQKTIQET